MKTHLVAICLLLLTRGLSAGEVEIIHVEIRKSGANLYQFDVTLKHSDTGWDHYADAWELLAPDGTLLGRRVLYHPHVNEQPFTRSLSNVEIAPGTGHVWVRAHDKIHGFSTDGFQVKLP